MHSKRDTVTSAIINSIKFVLNSLRIKLNEMNLIYAPKFHLLYEHVPFYLEYLNGFYDMGEEAIERWYQMRMRHHAHIKGLRSIAKQKNS